MREPLSVDPSRRRELERFTRYVVKGPGPSCWIWTGAIADDGYGRFWISRNGRQRVVRPHRYALALELGRPLTEDINALHEVCDNPICVRASDALGRPHVVAGTQAENLATMGAKGRGGGRPSFQLYGADKAARAARSRALREAVRGGWNQRAVDLALLASDEPTLF